MHLLSSKKFAGAEHIAADIIQYFMYPDKDIDIDIDMVYVSPLGEIEQSLKMRNIPYISLKRFSFFEVYKAVRQFKPDVIHAHDFKASCMAAIMPSGARIISHIHNNNKWAKKLSLKNILYIALSWRFEKIAIVSKSVIDEFAGGSFFRDKTQVVHNVVHELEILRKSEEYSVENSQIDFLFVGRLTEQKNPKRFIHLIHDVVLCNKDIRAVMVGEGNLHDEINVEINESGLQNNIKVTGFLENPYPYMKKAKTLLVTSDWEGFGLVAVEAMLLGCRVLVTPVGGLPDLVKGYREDWVCNNDADFLNQMKSAGPNEKERRQIREYAEYVNDEKLFIEKWDEIYFNN